MANRNKIYVGNLSSRVLQEDLESLFSRYGKIQRADIKFGFAFVEYYDVRDAEDAIDKLNGYEFKGSRLAVEPSKGPRMDGPRGPPRGGLGFRVQCENLPLDTPWQDLKDWARKAGNVTFVDVWNNREGRSANGVLEYATKDDIRSAFRLLDGAYYRDKRVYLSEERGGRGGGRDDDRRGGDRYRDSHRDRSRSRERRRSRSPVRRSRSRSPVRKSRSRSPVRSKSPVRSRSPVRRRSRSRSPSPARRSQSPRKRSASPRQRSPSESPRRDRSRSPARSGSAEKADKKEDGEEDSPRKKGDESD